MILGFSPRMMLQMDDLSLFISFMIFFFFFLSWFMCLLALYNLGKMNPDLTFGRPWSNYLDTCPIKILLEDFYTWVLALVILFKVIFLLMRPAKWLVVHLMRRGQPSCTFFFFSSLFNTKLPLFPLDLPHAPSDFVSRPFEVRQTSSASSSAMVV